MDRLVAHTHTHGVREYDGRHLPGKRAYLQCLLVKDVIFRLGVSDFRSDRPQGYYELLLHGKKEQHSATGYKKRLADEPKDARALRDFVEFAKRPRMRPIPPAVEDGAPEPVGPPGPRLGSVRPMCLMLKAQAQRPSVKATTSRRFRGSRQ